MWRWVSDCGTRRPFRVWTRFPDWGKAVGGDHRIITDAIRREQGSNLPPVFLLGVFSGAGSISSENGKEPQEGPLLLDRQSLKRVAYPSSFSLMKQHGPSKTGSAIVMHVIGPEPQTQQQGRAVF